MLRISWLFMVHNLIVTILPIGIITQLFYLKTEKKHVFAFILWIQLIFILNDFVIQPVVSLEYKYVMIFIGFFIGVRYIMGLSFISTLIVMVFNFALNAIATNINILVLLLTQFDSYGLALESDFIQYTSLVMVMCMVYLIIKTFDIRVLDIKRYD